MSNLFWESFDDFVLVEKKTIDDGAGGYITEWTDGVKIKALLTLGNAQEIRQAEAQNLKTVFTATFPINTPVKYDDYLENVDTKEIYRITGNPKDNKTPPTATFRTCFATAIRTELPNE